MVFQGRGRGSSPTTGGDRRVNANQTRSADMAMNPREAAKAKGYIDAVISLTRAKLLPQVPEMTSRLTHSANIETFAIRLPQISFGWCNERRRQGRLRLAP